MWNFKNNERKNSVKLQKLGKLWKENPIKINKKNYK